MEPISSHAEHARKCFKVEYLGRIEYDFQKTRVTGPWDHKVSISAKKVKKKFSCLCTFNKATHDDLSCRQAVNMEFCTVEKLIYNPASIDNICAIDKRPPPAAVSTEPGQHREPVRVRAFQVQ